MKDFLFRHIFLFGFLLAQSFQNDDLLSIHILCMSGYNEVLKKTPD